MLLYATHCIQSKQTDGIWHSLLMKLTHNDLMTLGQILEYPLIDDRGLCQGFSGMWMLAVLAKDEETFYERLHLISSYKNNFYILKKQIDSIKLRIKFNLRIKDSDRKLLDILSFFDGISVFLKPDKCNLFGGAFIIQDNLAAIYSLTKPFILENTNLCVLLQKIHAFNFNELKIYLNDLAMLLSGSSHPVPVLLGSSKHSVCLKYDKNDGWHYLDTDDFAEFPNEMQYYRKVTSEELTKCIFNSFTVSNEAVFTTTLLSTTEKNRKLNTACRVFDSRYPITSEHALRVNRDGVGLLYLACALGREDIVEKILQSPQVDINKASKDGFTPLYMACFHNHLNIVKLLLQKKAKINKRHDDDITALYMACNFGLLNIVKELLYHKANSNLADNEGFTPLSVACENGYMPIVQLLLADGNLNNVNTLDWKKNTPLHRSCYSRKTKNKPEIFKLLLANGASLSHKNVLGQTAIDIAFQRNNQTAIKELLNYAQFKKYCHSTIMSADTIKLVKEMAEKNAPMILSRYLNPRDSLKRVRNGDMHFFTEVHEAESKQKKVKYEMNCW